MILPNSNANPNKLAVHQLDAHQPQRGGVWVGGKRAWEESVEHAMWATLRALGGDE